MLNLLHCFKKLVIGLITCLWMTMPSQAQVSIDNPDIYIIKNDSAEAIAIEKCFAITAPYWQSDAKISKFITQGLVFFHSGKLIMASAPTMDYWAATRPNV